MEAESGHAASLPSYEQKDRAMHCLVLLCWAEFGQNDPVTSLVSDLKRVKDVNGAVKNPACQ